MIAILKEYLKRYKNAAKKLNNNWKEIQNMEELDFGKFYQSFGIQHIHRRFSGTDISLLAIFEVFEFLHNLNTFIDNVNSERKVKAINDASGMKICTLSTARTGKGFSENNKENCRPFMIEHYIMEIQHLKEGNITVRPEVRNYVFHGKNMSDEEKKEIEKQAACEALNILKESHNIIGFIEKCIEGDYNFL